MSPAVFTSTPEDRIPATPPPPPSRASSSGGDGGRLHVEPMSDVLFTEAAIYTADHSGCIKVWLRPKPGDEAAAADP